MRALIVPALALLFAASPAAAEPGEKSEATSFALSAGGTALSSTLIIASTLAIPISGELNEPLMIAGVGSMLVTPSIGQFYSGQYLTIGMGIRGIAAALTVYGMTRKQDQPCDLDPMENCPAITPTGLIVISLASIAAIGGIAYDVRDARPAAARHNKRLASKRGASLVPTIGGAALVGVF